MQEIESEQQFSRVETFEHGQGVVHVNARRSVVDGWSVEATVLHPAGAGEGALARIEMAQVERLDTLRFGSADDAVEAGERIAREYLDEIGS